MTKVPITPKATHVRALPRNGGRKNATNADATQVIPTNKALAISNKIHRRTPTLMAWKLLAIGFPEPSMTAINRYGVAARRINPGTTHKLNPIMIKMSQPIA